MILGLRRIRINFRLIAAMSMLLALLATVVLIGLSALDGQARATHVLADYARTGQLAERVRFRAADLNGWQTAYAFDIARGVPGATADATGARKAFLTSAAAFRADLDAMQGGRLTESEAGNVDGIAKNFEEFMALDGVIIQNFRGETPDRIAKANELVAIDEIEIYQRITADVEALNESLEREAASARDDAEATSASSSVVMIAVGAVAILIGAVLAVILVRSIVRPLGALNNRLAEIADGDGDLTQRVADASRDELGHAARAFDRFAARMQQLVGAVAAGAQQVAGAADELSAVSTQLAGGAEETSAQAGVVSSSAEEVSALVTTLAASAEQMNASIAEISRSASRASQISEGGVRAATEASDTVARLDASSSEIQTVVKLITDIASQTNLLALNATIEAARAGEVGKGFAVVASEVKELAQQTAAATESIARQVEAIREGSGAASSAIAEIAGVVTEINDTQLTIASAIEEQTATTLEMSRSVGETATGANEIASNILGVAQAAEQASAGAQSTRSTARDLVDAANVLKKLVSAFRY